MGKSVSKEQLKKELIDLLLKDKEIRTYLVGILVESFATKEDIKTILEEIKRLREDFDKRMEEMREDFNKRMEEMREDFNKRMEAFERRMDSFEKRMLEMREDFNKGIKTFDDKLSALGARWGIFSEEAFRNALRGILEEHFKAKVSRWERRDEEGFVFGVPSVIDVDVLIIDDKHILIEIKSHVRRSDILVFLRISEFYEKVEGVKPELIMVTPFVDKNAKEYAKLKGIKIYTIEDLRKP